MSEIKDPLEDLSQAIATLDVNRYRALLLSYQVEI